MTVSALVFFGGAVNSATGFGSWVNPANALNSGSFSTHTFPANSATDSSDTLVLSNPNIGVVPAGWLFSDVTIQYRISCNQGTTPQISPLLQFTGGTQRTGPWVSDTLTTYTLSGSPSTWGLTNAQMREVFSNARNFNYALFCAGNILASSITSLDWVMIQATYTAPVPTRFVGIF